MQASERNEFDTQIQQLCAGFNVPVGDRTEAYWRGLGKMPLHTLARVVEFALGEDGPEKIPTSHQCWGMAKQLRFRAPVQRAAEPAWTCDALGVNANLRLLRHVNQKAQRYHPDVHVTPAGKAEPGPLGTAITKVLLEHKRTWTEDMRVESKPSHAFANSLWLEVMEAAERRIEVLLAASRARIEAA